MEIRFHRGNMIQCCQATKVAQGLLLLGTVVLYQFLEKCLLQKKKREHYEMVDVLKDTPQL